MEWGAWWATVHGVAKSQTRLSDFSSLLLFLRICLFQTPPVNGIIQYLSFCVWLTSLSTMFSRFIQVVDCIRVILLTIEWYSIVCTSDYKESWAPKNWCFWTMVLEKTFESTLYCKEIQPVHPERKQSWVFIGRTFVEAETPKLWPPDVKSWLIGKDPDAGKDLRQEQKGTTEDEMVGWHHRLNGDEFG